MTLPSAAIAQVRTISQANAKVAAAGGSSQSGLIDMVVLVDESGSETAASIKDEQATTLEVASSLLNAGSRVTVIGFGGVNDPSANQDPTNVACPPTPASNQNTLATCIKQNLYPRTLSQGNDTDYAAALGQAMSYFDPTTAAGQQSPLGATKVILMMTDGAADVHNDTKQYTSDWYDGELTAVNDQLATAKQDNVQFWALGFGSNIGTDVDGKLVTKAAALQYLNHMAAAGAPAVCNGQPAPVQPYARWVDSSSDAFNTMGQLSADASCSGFATGSRSIKIPDYASSAVISVNRGSPQVGVTFVQPDGQPWTDASALSGQDSSAVESLHLNSLTSAEVGTWTIRLNASGKSANQVAQVSASWRGTVSAVVTANPSSAKPGQSICSELTLRGPRGPVDDAADIVDFKAGITSTGDGGTKQVTITSTGQAGCPTSGPGTYAGAVAAPSGSGTVTFTGTVAGYGLSTSYVPAAVTVRAITAPFSAAILYPLDSAGIPVQAGSGIPLTVTFNNSTGSPQKVLLTVKGDATKPTIGGTSPEVTVPAGKQETVSFSVAIPANSPKGLDSVQVAAVDAGNPSHAFNTASFDVMVTKPPGIWGKYRWYIIGLIILLVLILLYLWRRRAVTRWRMDVRGLTAYLRREETQLSELPAKTRAGDSFFFVIRDPEEKTAQLDYAESGLPPYTVRRSGNREVTLTTPAGARFEDVVLGQDSVPVASTKLQLAFTDDRRRPRPWWAAGVERGPRRRRRKLRPPAPPSFGTPGQPPSAPTPGAPEPAGPAGPASPEPTNELL
ncbi:MAG: VWA domain-containing protein [Streptosporangiaceae bacterium]